MVVIRGGRAAERLAPAVADADDWPKALYARLGFDAIGGTYLFTRSAEG